MLRPGLTRTLVETIEVSVPSIFIEVISKSDCPLLNMNNETESLVLNRMSSMDILSWLSGMV